MAQVLRDAAGGREVLVDADMAATVGDAGSAPIKMKVISPSAARTATAKALGRGFGSIELIYQITRAVRPDRVLRSRKDRPLQPADARRVLADQLAAHNAVRGAKPPILSWLQ